MDPKCKHSLAVLGKRFLGVMTSYALYAARSILAPTTKPRKVRSGLRERPA